MKIPSPHEAGLPEQFDKWRPSQEQALEIALLNQKRVTSFCLPTGSGKSPLVVAVAKLSGDPTCVVTNSRALQSQYMSDFESVGMVDIRGRNNYTCDMKPEYTCEEGFAARCPYKGTVGCPASQAEMRAATSNLVITNYAKWCSSRKFGTGMSHFRRVIFDEGHDAYGALANAMQVTLHFREIEENLGIGFLDGNDAEEFANWKPWASKARVIAEQAMLAAKVRISGLSDPKASWVRHYTHMRNLARKLATLSTASARDWVVDQTDVGYQFDPIRPGRYSESALLLKVPKIMIVSATLRPKSMFMLGIGKDNFQFQEFNSDFDPNRCPIYYKPTMRVDKNHTDLRPIWLLHDQIASQRKDRNGLVHTISYARQEDIKAVSRFANRMVFNEKGEPPTSKIKEFVDSYPGGLLVSPNIGTGYDFKMRAAEWQILCKIPFPDSRSKIVRARQDDDPEYGPYIAVQYMVQAFGRLMRDKADQGESFIGDEHMNWFIPKWGHLAPRSFHGNYKKIDRLPPPPQKL